MFLLTVPRRLRRRRHHHSGELHHRRQPVHPIRLERPVHGALSRSASGLPAGRVSGEDTSGSYVGATSHAKEAGQRLSSTASADEGESRGLHRRFQCVQSGP